jgi:methionyl aminopeptidase
VGFLDEEALKAYLEAGRIAKIVREEAAKRVEAGMKIREFCEWVESRIKELGGQPAFPCNIGINYVAAHYTPTLDDENVIPENSIIKIDLGVHINGYIADTATTVDLSGRYTDLLEAVREALDRALKAVAPNVKFSEVGKIIESTIRGRGFQPIVNLGGHSIARYRIHAGESIPNAYEPLLRGRFQCGKAYAIEPFGTTGAGVVEEADIVTIYALVRTGIRRRLDETSKKVLATIASRFKTLPFCERWLADVAEKDQLRRALRKLSRMGFLMQYPVLLEKKRGVVAQFEHTLVITDNCEVIVTTG